MFMQHSFREVRLVSFWKQAAGSGRYCLLNCTPEQRVMLGTLWPCLLSQGTKDT
jgi:hypothetical protein